MHCLIYLIVKLLSYIPFGALYALSDVMYYPLYYIVRYRRHIVRRNLTESFPEKSPAEILRIERRFYHFFMDLVFESCKLASISPAEIRRRMKFVDADMANGLLAQGQSLAYFIGHYGNWEWMTSVRLWIDSGVVCTQVYRKLRSRTFDALMKRLRERLGNTCIEMHTTARFVADAKARGQRCMIALIADQSPKRREIKHYVHFLNHSVPALTGPEKITKHFGYVPVFVSVSRVARGYYECRFERLSDTPASIPDYELTDLYYRRLEQEIRRQPECYLWTHNRFKYAQH